MADAIAQQRNDRPCLCHSKGGRSSVILLDIDFTDLQIGRDENCVAGVVTVSHSSLAASTNHRFARKDVVAEISRRRARQMSLAG